MIVIADGGSNTTHWRVVNTTDGSVAQKFTTMGFNPYFHSSEVIYNELQNEVKVLDFNPEDVTDVYFYGAGCNQLEKNQIVETALLKIFGGAKVEVQEDLLAVARANFGTEPGIACIIGTGSNSCVWDGQKITKNIPSYGYIYGDEGSGAYLGKELLKLYLNDKMEENVRKQFDEHFGISKVEILDKTYVEKNPNVFMASFAKFYSMSDSPELKRIVSLGIVEFFVFSSQSFGWF